MQPHVPAGQSGRWAVEHFTVSQKDSERTRLFSFGRDYVPPGDYVRLALRREGATEGGAVVMSDTPMEQHTNLGVAHEARGDVLIAGLGIGMVLWRILHKPEVDTVLVVERSADVIALVLPAMMKHPHADKLAVVEGDIFEWKPEPGRKFDCIYFDIWTDVCTDNLADMAKLHQRFKGRKKPGAWMDSWQRGTLKYRREQERRAGW
jgi:hypothetical protein